MGTTTTTFALNKPTVGGDDNAWGSALNDNADKLDDLLDGTTAIKPNLSEGLWKVGGVAVTSTAAELNILDGVTASAAEINVLDGIPGTLTATELGYVDGVTSAIQTQLNGKQATISVTASRALVSNVSGAVAASTVTSTELGYLSGVTSAIQTQINTIVAGQVNITGAASTIDTEDLTINRAVISNASGKIAVSTVTSTELGYVSGVTSAIQTQLDNKQALDADLTAIAGLSSNGLVARTGAGTAAARTVTAGTGITVTDGDGVAGNPTVAATLASQAEAEAGTDNTKLMTPLRLRNALNATGSAPIYACRAWVNFNGTGTVAIRASGNVTSITDNGTGDYTVNFTTAMSDANYAAMITGNTDIPAGSDYGVIPVIHPTVAQTTSSVRILCQFAGNGTLYDLSQVNVAIFR